MLTLPSVVLFVTAVSDDVGSGDRETLSTTATYDLVGVAKDEARGEFVLFPVHFRTNQKHHGRGINEQGDALFLNPVLELFLFAY